LNKSRGWVTMTVMIRFLIWLPALLWCVANAPAQGTAFNYQGRLSDTGSAASGNYDFRLVVYNALTNGSAVSGALTNTAVPVTNGLFSVTLDFGPGVFTGNGAWLDLSVRTNGNGPFSALAPRQPILPVPYAVFAGSASNLTGAVGVAQLTGTLSSTQLAGTYSSAVAFTNAGNTLVGNGAGLTALNGSAVTAGTIADARLTTNVALLNTSQTFTGSNIFSGGNTFAGTNQFPGPNNFTSLGNNFYGSFFGNGLVGWVTVATNYVQATNFTGYLLTSPAFTTVVLPAASLAGAIVRVSGAGAGGWQISPNINQSLMGNFNSYDDVSLLSSGASANNWRALAVSANGVFDFAAGNFTSGVEYSTDSGQTWSSSSGITGSGWFAIACSADGSRVYAAPNGGNIMMSTNGGVSFTSSITTGNLAWTSVACSADGTRVIAGATGQPLALTYGSSPATASWTAVASSANGTNLAAAAATKVYCSTNAGTSWNNVTLGGTCSALVASSSGGKLFAAFNGGVAVSTNFGGSWITTNAPNKNFSCLASSSDGNRLIAGVTNGLLYTSMNLGASWTAIIATNQNWSSVAMSADGSKFTACTSGSAGTIYYSGLFPQVSTYTNGLSGSQGSAVELQYIGNNQFMPVSSTGTIWAN
jgi:hypothetical protein